MNTKQTIFVNEYLKCWNSAEAARRAGYNGKSNVIGPRLLADVSIKAEIKQRVDALAMSADEALILLSEQARGSLSDFADVKMLEDLKGHPKARLVKALTSDVYEDKGGRIHYKCRIELQDQQRAIEDILKIHGKFSTDVTIDLPLDSNFEHALKRAYGHTDNQPDS